MQTRKKRYTMAAKQLSGKMLGFYTTAQIRKAARLNSNQAVRCRAKARGDRKPAFRIGTTDMWDQQAYDALVVNYGRGRAAAQMHVVMANEAASSKPARRQRLAS